MEIDWSTSVPASALHAALALLEGRTLVEPTIAEALQPALDGWQAELATAGAPASDVLRELIPLSSADADLALATSTALDKILGRRRDRQPDPAIAGAAEELVTVLIAVRPRLADELPLRIEPLRNQWEARGPGLLAAVRRLAAAELLVPAAEVVLVHPVLGGGGRAHAAGNRVTFEGLLANPLPRLPEVLRLGWLLAQLNFDLPALSEPLERSQIAAVGPLALIPLVLAAGDDVELARSDDESLRLALDAWTGSAAAAEPLTDWWETYRTTRPSWPAALAALSTLLSNERAEKETRG